MGRFSAGGILRVARTDSFVQDVIAGCAGLLLMWDCLVLQVVGAYESLDCELRDSKQDLRVTWS